MKLSALVKNLKTKDQAEDVEFIVVSKTGKIICMSVEKKASDIVKMLKMMPSDDE